jgi:hypothetical protein
MVVVKVRIMITMKQALELEAASLVVKTNPPLTKAQNRPNSLSFLLGRLGENSDKECE